MSIRKVILSSGESKWEVRVHENGRGSKRITRRFDRKNDAEGFLLDLKKEIRSRDKDPFSGISLKDRKFKDEALVWLNDGKLRFSESHLLRVRGLLDSILSEFGELTIEKFTPELLSKIQQSEKLKGLSNSSANRKTEVITAILNFSTKQRRIPYNPSIGFKKLKPEAPEMQFWNHEEATSFLTKMDELYPRDSKFRWIYVSYVMALNTAMRAGEIWGLQVQDISPEGSSLWVRRQFNRVTLDFGPTKGKKARHVPCPLDLYQELQSLIKNQKLKAQDVLFRNEKGNPICHDNFSDRQFSKDQMAWGGKRIRFHDLRHTATTLMIAGGVDIKTVKEICGHADISTTMNYVHLLSGSIVNVSKLFSLKSSVQRTPTRATRAPFLKVSYIRFDDNPVFKR